MGIPRQNPDPMTAEEFFAFTQTRPDEEKWELIEGEPILNPTANSPHQRILVNLLRELTRLEAEQGRTSSGAWEVLPGLGVRVSRSNVPVPDALVRPSVRLKGAECRDMIIAFEVLSPSTPDRNLHWKRKAYASLPSLQHYVVLAQDAVQVFVYDRANGFAEQRLEQAGPTLDLKAISASLSLADICWNTGLECP
jgi:Uma2 family endonuclease